MSAKNFNPIAPTVLFTKLAHALFVSLPNWMAAGMRSLRNETVKWAFLLGGAAFLLSSVAQPTIVWWMAQPTTGLATTWRKNFSTTGGRILIRSTPSFWRLSMRWAGAYFAVYLVQGLLLALTVGLSYWLARHLAGHGAGVFAALLVTLDATLLGNVGLIATENLQTPLLSWRDAFSSCVG